jgi:hypothetical protein
MESVIFDKFQKNAPNLLTLLERPDRRLAARFGGKTKLLLGSGD